MVSAKLHEPGSEVRLNRAFEQTPTMRFVLTSDLHGDEPKLRWLIEPSEFEDSEEYPLDE